MTRPIGYYVHHHGEGHRQRGIAIARAASGSVTLLGTGLAGRTGGISNVDLPDDRREGTGYDENDGGHRPASLHYAPVDLDNVRYRVSRIGAWIAEMRPALFVVDVSVEVAMLARLASVPTVYVRLSGLRDDRPHREAFDAAKALLAPWHADFEAVQTPPSVREKTFYAPGIGTSTPRNPPIENVVLGVVGRGGGVADGECWAAAARAVPDRLWRVIGPVTVPRDLPDNLELRGWVEDAACMIASAAVVVGAAGDGLVSTVLTHARPFICIPEPRPFDEQTAKAARLDALCAAIVSPVWPEADQWRALIDRALLLDPRTARRLGGEDGAGRVARWLRGLAEGHAIPLECTA